MRQQEKQSSKTILAKILSQENITVNVVRQFKAEFNPKTRVLSMPAVRNDIPDSVINMLVAHEVSHALYTPFVSLDEECRLHHLNYSTLNIVEDVRIERLIKDDYPGLKREFVLAYKELLNRNAFKTRDLVINNMGLLDRLNLHAKCGSLLNVKFTSQEQVFVDLAFAAETWDDVVETSKAIARFLKQKKEPKQNNPLPLQMPVTDSDDTENSPEPDYENEDESEDESDDGDEDNRSDPDYENDDTENSPEPDYENEDESEDESNDNDDGVDNDEDNRSEPDYENSDENESKINDDNTTIPPEEDPITDDALETNKSRLFEYLDPNATPPKAYNIHIKSVDYKPLIVSYKDIRSIIDSEMLMADECWEEEHEDAYSRWGQPEARASNIFKLATGQHLHREYFNLNDTIIKYMVKEFNLKKSADQYKRATIAKTGELAENLLYSYRFNDDIFMKNTVFPEGQSHGMLLYLDWSGSMRTNLTHSLHQLYSILDFCKKVKIPFEVYAFAQKENNEILVEDEISIKSLQLLHFFSHKMTTEEHATMQRNLLFLAKYRAPNIPLLAMGGTPLNEAIVCAMSMVPDFQTSNKLEIVNTVFVSDGESNPLNFGGYAAHCDDLFFEDFKHNRVKAKGETLDITEKLLTLLQQNTKTNVIGFFLTDGVQPRFYKMLPKMSQSDVEAEFTNNGFLISSNAGYTDYFIINTHKMEIKKKEASKSVAELLFRNKKVLQDRILLNRFINLIAKQPF